MKDKTSPAFVNAKVIRIRKFKPLLYQNKNTINCLVSCPLDKVGSNSKGKRETKTNTT